MFKISALIGILLLVAVPLFFHLDKQPFRLWDESRLATNAFEMSRNGNLIVTYYQGEPEMWNTKPPMMIWLQLLFIKTLGFGELAVRLPAALAGLITCVLLIYFSKKITHRWITGACAALVLVTSNGYIDAHAIRTGDYDGLLALFTTAFILSAYAYAQTGRSKWIRSFFISLALAVLTKSVQPLLFLPGLGLYFMIKRREVTPFIKRYRTIKKILVWALASALLVVAYYITREAMNEGYLAAIWKNELGGRYLEALEENAAGPSYYFSWIFNHMFIYWIWLLPFAFIAGFFSRRQTIKSLTLFLFIVSTTYLIFITASATKLYWYAVPLLPLFALQVGILFTEAYHIFSNVITKPQLKQLAFVCLLALVFIYPYYFIAKKVYYAKEYEWDNEVYPIANLMKKAFHGKTSVTNHVIVYTDYDQHLRLYAQALAAKGQMVRFKNIEDLKAGDTVVVSQKAVVEKLKSMDNSNVLKQEHEVTFFVMR